MGNRTIFCVLCGEDYSSGGEMPWHCPKCLRLTAWRAWPTERASRERTFTENDKKFLKSLRIAPTLSD